MEARGRSLRASTVQLFCDLDDPPSITKADLAAVFGRVPQILDVFTWRIIAGRSGPRSPTTGDLARARVVEDLAGILAGFGIPNCSNRATR